jgi:hypothetical protein
MSEKHNFLQFMRFTLPVHICTSTAMAKDFCSFTFFLSEYSFRFHCMLFSFSIFFTVFKHPDTTKHVRRSVDRGAADFKHMYVKNRCTEETTCQATPVSGLELTRRRRW